jgi:hypothetical protein
MDPHLSPLHPSSLLLPLALPGHQRRARGLCAVNGAAVSNGPHELVDGAVERRLHRGVLLLLPDPPPAVTRPRVRQHGQHVVPHRLVSPLHPEMASRSEAWHLCRRSLAFEGACRGFRCRRRHRSKIGAGSLLGARGDFPHWRRRSVCARLCCISVRVECSLHPAINSSPSLHTERSWFNASRALFKTKS